MLDPFDGLGGAMRVAATWHDFIGAFVDRGAAFRAYRWQRNRSLIAGAQLLQDLNHVGDHVAGAFNNHMVANAKVETGNFVPVMQAGPENRDAADGERLEVCDRGEGAGAADLQADSFEEGVLLTRGKFTGEGTARRAAAHD